MGTLLGCLGWPEKSIGTWCQLNDENCALQQRLGRMAKEESKSALQRKKSLLDQNPETLGNEMMANALVEEIWWKKWVNMTTSTEVEEIQDTISSALHALLSESGHWQTGPSLSSQGWLKIWEIPEEFLKAPGQLKRQGSFGQLQDRGLRKEGWRSWNSQPFLSFTKL